MENKIAIVYSSDGNVTEKNYLRYSLDSFKKYVNCDYYILKAPDFGNMEMFQDVIGIDITNEMVQEYIPIKKHSGLCHITFPTFYRLMIPMLDQFKKYDQVLYLDCDTYCNRDPYELFNYKNGMIVGVDEPGAKEKLQHKRFDGIRQLKTYINAGVMLFNMNKLVDYKKYLDKMISNQNTYNFPMLDQDMINSVMDIENCDYKFNTDSNIANGNTVIIHYVCLYGKYRLNKILRESGKYIKDI